MIISGANVFVDGRFTPLDVEVNGGKISALHSPSGDLQPDLMLIPGIVDIHTHGCGGFDFSTASQPQLEQMMHSYLLGGTTTVLATIMTDKHENMVEAARRIGDFAPKSDRFIGGILMEGPFFMPSKKGAHDERCLCDCDEQKMKEIATASGNALRAVVLDPERPGFDDLCGALKKAGIVVAIGHTDADYEKCKMALDGGASHVTHLYNAMPPLHHRNPGLVGAALDGNCTAELICDMVHLAPAIVRISFAVLGERAVIISDSMAACGMPDGQYVLGGLSVAVQNGKATLQDGTIAGSAVSAFEGMRRAIAEGVPPESAVYAATTAPAKAAGISDICGNISVGAPADFLLCTPDFSLKEVYKSGNCRLSPNPWF